MEKRLEQVLCGLSFLALLLLLAAVWQASTPQWKSYQHRFQQLEAQSETNPAARAALMREPLAIHQLMITGLGRVDRCTTCHLGVDDPTMKNAPEPFRYHAGLGPHSPAKFGCTVCHGGQGLATDKENAHGGVAFWADPLLSSDDVRATCGRCHTDGEVPGVPQLADGRNLFETSGCRGCHKLNGRGGAIGPDLTAEAEMHRSPDWLERHFLDPAAVVADSAMPKLKLSRLQIHALTYYMLSLSAEKMGAYYVSLRLIPSASYGQQLFAEKNCVACHAIGGAGGRTGPDLQGVANRRSVQWLDEQLADPQTAYPGTAMPNYGLELSARKALVAYLGAATPAEAKEMFAKQKQILKPDEAAIESGRLYFVHSGCPGCHGPQLEGGVPNRNAQGGEVPSLLHLAEDYTKDEVLNVVRKGRAPPLANPSKPAPPLYMPTWKAVLSEEDIERIVNYLWSKQEKPKEEEAW
jgi:mono/diheme cytochrome c family protein